MKYCGKNITRLDMAKFIAKLWATKTFGSRESYKINPETGERDPDGVLRESARHIARCAWARIFDKDLIIDQIWYEKASEEEQEARVRCEMADEHRWWIGG
jgi:hypothetical protein